MHWLTKSLIQRLERKEVVIVVVHKHREHRMEIGYLTIFLLFLLQEQSMRSLV